MPHAIIAGTGRHLPDKVLTNHDLEKMVQTSDQWIMERTGIRERRIADKGISASDLAVPAAKKAMAAAGVAPEEVDLILVGTSTPDMFFPSTACFVQAKLGCVNAAAFDMLAACSGWVYGMTVANAFIRGGQYKTVLVIGAEVYSHILNWEDRATCVLFGDGAGAVLLKASDTSEGILSANIFSDGSKSEFLYAPGGGSSSRFTPELVAEKKYTLAMVGNSTFKVAVKMMADAATKAMKENNVTPADIKLVIPHQANLRIISAVAKQLGMPEEHFFSNLQKYGNTAAASIPIALDEALEQGLVGKGDLVLMVTFGGGFTWGSLLIRL